MITLQEIYIGLCCVFDSKPLDEQERSSVENALGNVWAAMSDEERDETFDLMTAKYE